MHSSLVVPLKDCRSVWPRSNFGIATNSRVPTLSKGASTPRAFRSRRRRVFVGSRTYATLRTNWAIPTGACTLGIAKATSTNCSARRKTSERTSYCGPASIDLPATVNIPSPARWPKCAAKVFTGSIARSPWQSIRGLFWNSNSVVFVSCRPSVSRAVSRTSLTVLHATERTKPRGREPIVWKLITYLPVTSRALAIEKLNWYAMRWKIETFHKIMKSGCRIEQSSCVRRSAWSISWRRPAFWAGAFFG